MQFNVPQFTDVEDKIFGPLSLKQFLLFIGGGVIIFFLWYLFQLWVVIIVAVPLVGFLLAMVFVKINGRSFFSYSTAWFSYLTNPRIFIWKKKH